MWFLPSLPLKPYKPAVLIVYCSKELHSSTTYCVKKMSFWFVSIFYGFQNKNKPAMRNWFFLLLSVPRCPFCQWVLLNLASSANRFTFPAVALCSHCVLCRSRLSQAFPWIFQTKLHLGETELAGALFFPDYTLKCHSFLSLLCEQLGMSVCQVMLRWLILRCSPYISSSAISSPQCLGAILEAGWANRASPWGQELL